MADDFFDLAANCLERDTERFECLGGHPFALVDQAEQNVLSADVAVVEETCFLLRQHHHPPSPIGEAFKHGGSVSAHSACNVSAVHQSWQPNVTDVTVRIARNNPGGSWWTLRLS